MSYRNYYDTSSYGRSRDSRPTSHASDRPTSVTAKYLPTPYKTSSIPIISRDRSSTRDDQSPISAIANKYSSYSKINRDDKPTPKYDKKDYNKLSVPSLNSSKSREVSPTSSYNKYSPRTTRALTPERKSKTIAKSRSPDPASDRDKDIPNKTEKSIGYNNLTNYKVYPRTSYTRPTSRAEIKPEITVNRYSIANRLSSNYLRSPSADKSRTSISPVKTPENNKAENRPDPTLNSTRDESKPHQINTEGNDSNHQQQNGNETISVITRHTSPTPPGSSAYVRSRRADMAKTIEKTITRSVVRPEMVDKETQSDRLDDPTRNSRFASTARTSVAGYTGYSPTSNNYTGYAGRYSTQYSNLREGNNLGINYDRSSRSRSKEPCSSEVSYNSSNDLKEIENKISSSNRMIESMTNSNRDLVTAVYEQKEDDDDGTSEIIINVNLKLKKTKSSLNNSSTEIVSPEITITNSQLPPQAPKSESAPKLKKIKSRKSSTDSSSDSSSKKKVVKKKTKQSASSSADSDTGSEANSSEKSKSKSIKNKSTSSTESLSKPIKSRESNSPESSTTLSTQSSVSEDEPTSKSKSNEISRTSADEVSIPTDKSEKPSQGKNSKNSEGAEEAKSFLIRALAPVTNLFKTKHQDSCDSHWLQSSTSESTGKDVSNIMTESEGITKSKSNTDDIVASNNDNLVQLKAIRHIESGERAWWMDNDSSKKSSSEERRNSNSDRNIPRRITHIESGERAWWLEDTNEEKKDDTTSTSSNIDKPLRVNNFNDDDKPWWLDSSANVPDGVECLTSSRKTSSESEKSEKFDFFKVRHINSGEQKDWWLTSSEKSSSNNRQEMQNTNSSEQKSMPLQRIRHIESGERPWWLSGTNKIPDGVEKLPTPQNQTESESSDSEEMHMYVTKPSVPPFPINMQDDEPLGDRRSPEGLETPRVNENYNGRVSPYENNRQYSGRNTNMMYQKTSEKYISRYMDIDDILGTSSQIYSPFMDSILAKRTGLTFDEDMSECEEIDSTQVKIHDSTAQRPVIKKLRTRGEIIDCRGEDQIKQRKQGTRPV